MLKKFTVENYRSFEKPITLDFTPYHEFNYDVSPLRESLLDKIVIYGPNASGKSNLGFALFDIVGLLTDKQLVPQDDSAFINADSGKNEAVFTYEFKMGEDIITYCYKKASPKKLTYESLTVNKKSIFTYDFEKGNGDFVHMNLIGAENLNFEYFGNNLALLRFIANNTKQEENSPVRFVMNFVMHMLWFRSLRNNGYMGLMTGPHSIDDWMIENEYVEDFQSFLKEFAGVVRNVDGFKFSKESTLLVEVHKHAYLSFNRVASSGTNALKLFYYWSKRFKEVSLLYMDEFDAYYHFKLAKKVLQYVIGFDNLQAVLTTHDPYLASNDILRPDSYFMLRDGKLVSFPDSTERELKPGHSLDKMLRNGEFNG